MKSKIIRGVMLILLVVIKINLYAHGVEYNVSRGEVFIVTVMYDDGELMNYSAYKIFQPDGKTVFQSGTTDKNGKISFIPDSEGDWTAEVNDGAGHGVSVKINIDESLSESTIHEGLESPVRKIVMALSILWGFAGTALYFRGKASSEKL